MKINKNSNEFKLLKLFYDFYLKCEKGKLEEYSELDLWLASILEEYSYYLEK